MNYYFSGIGNFDFQQKERLAGLCTYRLQSCHKEYIRQTHDWLSYAAKCERQVTIMLDSGAFTAWSKGGEVELDPLMRIYDELLEKYGDGLKDVWLINLDKIPGQRGRTASAKEIVEAIRISDYNYNRLIDAFGERVLPVFHQNEPTSRLREVANMADYICVSPRNDVGEKHRITWSAEVHSRLEGKNKTHGLATTGMKMANMVPWYSADSAWWLQTAINGSIMYLAHDQIIKTVQVSEHSGARKDRDQHYATMAPPYQKYIDERLAVHGYTFKDVSEHHNPRMMVNILEILEWLKVARVDPIPVCGLFDL